MTTLTAIALDTWMLNFFFWSQTCIILKKINVLVQMLIQKIDVIKLFVNARIFTTGIIDYKSEDSVISFLRRGTIHGPVVIHITQTMKTLLYLIFLCESKIPIICHEDENYYLFFKYLQLSRVQTFINFSIRTD